ncbi:MFS transporter [Nonomuraea spiralis]|uniref:MFS transporter n=1 Tax=Nonomuraea spiralis TaxID=46182 RepID=UPI0037A38EB6
MGMQVGMSFLVTMGFTTSVVYYVDEAGLNPFQLVMLGTVLEGAYFLIQLPTGMLADLVSRRACVVAGVLVYGGGMVLQGMIPTFVNLLIAQGVLALGAALMSGAQESWVADETREAEMARVYLRASQLGSAGTIAGSLLSGLVAMMALSAPLVVAGALMAAGGVALALFMPENNFHRPERASGFGTVLRQAGSELGGQMRDSCRIGRAVPGLVFLLGMTFCFGLWSESFDRLFGAFLLEDITFPDILGLEPAMWFSILTCATGLASMIAAGWTARRAERLGSGAIIGMLVLSTLVTAAGALAMGLSRTFALAVAFLMVVSAARQLYGPLVDGWLVTRVDPKARATALSARDMFDSGGQIIGGPLVGAIGSVISIRAALTAGAALLVPAVLFLAGADRRIKSALADAAPADAAPADAAPADAAPADAAPADAAPADAAPAGADKEAR